MKNAEKGVFFIYALPLRLRNRLLLSLLTSRSMP
ncbi:hypothetical protein PMI17_01409 [Pantoea sp. GM01]|nr:hypothetical protein PMI17_01409 [Pantoea sp. GM01]